MLDLLIIHKGTPLLLNSFFIDFHWFSLPQPRHPAAEGEDPVWTHNHHTINAFIYSWLATAYAVAFDRLLKGYQKLPKVTILK
jgi:hypothetical protein